MATPKKPIPKKPLPKKPVPKAAPPAAPHPATAAVEEAQAPVEEAPVEEAPETEGEFKLPRGISQEEYDTAKAIIVGGFANDADPDAIKGAMFENGIAFSKLVRLYTLITTQERLVVPAKEVRDNLGEWFTANPPDVAALSASFTTADQLAKFLCAEVEGCTPRAAFAAIKKYLEENGAEMPKKPKGMGRTSGVAKLIVNAFAANTEITFEEYKALLEPITTEKSINRWLGLYKCFSLIAANEPFPG